MRIFAFSVALILICAPISADDWPQWRGPQRDGVWRETGILKTLSQDDLKVRWRVPISGGYSGPTVADGRVYVTDRVVNPRQRERVLCFDWETGKSLWSYNYNSEYRNIGYGIGPRAGVTIHGGLAYTLGSMGQLHCFDAVNGDVRWKRDLNAEYEIRMPTWGITSAPLIEDDLLILQIGGVDGACIVAFNRITGEEVWRALDDPPSYSAPIVIDQAGKRVLVCWTGRSVVGLDPKSGDAYWQVPWEPFRGVIAVASPVLYDDLLLFTSFYDGARLLRAHQDQMGIQELWLRRGKSELQTDAIHSIISTPMIQGDYIYGVDSYGELRCLDLMTGDRVWEDLSAVPKARWSTIHFTPQENGVWMFTERGELMISELSPEGLKVISRVQLIEPTRGQLNRRGGVCWAHPAYAYKHIFVRNDEELICVNLAE